MGSLREPLRVGAAFTLGAFAGAAELAVLLIVFSNVDAHQPMFRDISLARIFWMSVAFCLFTLPVSWAFGVPLYWLMRRFHLLRVWVCSVLGGIVGGAGLYGICLAPSVHCSVTWIPVLWLSLSGAAAGTLVGLLLQPKTVS